MKSTAEIILSCSATERGPISSVETCPKCGSLAKKIMFLGMSYIDCPECVGKNEEEERQKREIERNEQRAMLEMKRLSDRLAGCQIGDRFRGQTFADYKPPCAAAAKILEKCKQYVDDFTPNNGASLLMLGSPGTGKNMLAAIICQELAKKGFFPLHTTAMKMVRRVKDSWKGSDEKEQALIDSFVTPALLVVDEIGVQFGSTTEQIYQTEILNERYERRKPTILISNLTLSQLTLAVGERIIDRFYDDNSEFLVFDWPSFRRQPKR